MKVLVDGSEMAAAHDRSPFLRAMLVEKVEMGFEASPGGRLRSMVPHPTKDVTMRNERKRPRAVFAHVSMIASKNTETRASVRRTVLPATFPVARANVLIVTIREVKEVFLFVDFGD
jgi:hypothetical protein